MITSNGSSSFSKSANISSQTSTRGAEAKRGADPISVRFQTISNKIQSQIDTVTSSLTDLGKFKSAVAQTQYSAQALISLNNGKSLEEAKVAVTDFINKFNEMAKASSTVDSNTSSAGRISRRLIRTMENDLSNISSLRNMGVSKNADGTYNLNTATFSSLYKSSPSEVISSINKAGNLINKITTKELAHDGSFSQTSNNLKNTKDTLQYQKILIQKALQQYTNFSSSSG